MVFVNAQDDFVNYICHIIFYVYFIQIDLRDHLNEISSYVSSVKNKKHFLLIFSAFIYCHEFKFKLSALEPL